MSCHLVIEYSCENVYSNISIFVPALQLKKMICIKTMQDINSLMIKGIKLTYSLSLVYNRILLYVLNKLALLIGIYTCVLGVTDVVMRIKLLTIIIHLHLQTLALHVYLVVFAISDENGNHHMTNCIYKRPAELVFNSRASSWLHLACIVYHQSNNLHRACYSSLLFALSAKRADTSDFTSIFCAAFCSSPIYKSTI